MSPGNVVIHSDPRLLLLKKHPAPPAEKTVVRPATVKIATTQARPMATLVTPPAKTAETRSSLKPVTPLKKETPVRETVSPAVARKESPAASKPTMPAVTEPIKTLPAQPEEPEDTVADSEIATPKAAAAILWPPVHPAPPTFVKTKGFRVQIYNGPDRKKAAQIKTQFMRQFPGVRSYMLYISPTFRVRVGDFRLRGDAMALLKQAKTISSPIMIVPDSIQLSN